MDISYSIRRYCQPLLAIIMLLLSPIISAVDTISLSLETGWLTENTTIRTTDLTMNLVLIPTGLALIGKARQLDLPAPYGKINNLTINCQNVLWTAAQVICKRGTLSFKHATLGKQNLTFVLNGHPQQQQYHFSLSQLSIAGGALSISGDWSPKDWSVEITTTDFDVPTLLGITQGFGVETALLSPWLSAATLKLSAILSGKEGRLLMANITESWTGVTGSDADGKWVAEGVNVASEVVWNAAAQQWDITADITGGEAYAEPVFFDFSKQPFSIKGNGSWMMDTGNFNITHAALIQHGVASATLVASGNIAAWQDTTLQADVSQIDLAAAYITWLQPFLLANAAGNMTLAGMADLKLSRAGEALTLQVSLQDAAVQDDENRFAISGLSGSVGWTTQAQTVITDLQWKSGLFYAIPFGAAQLHAQSTLAGLQFTQPFYLPILEGGLQINEFVLSRPLHTNTAWHFAGEVTAVSMPLLSEKLGWPTMSGTLSGLIPRVSYMQKQITVEGDLTVDLFGGRTVVQDLSLRDPFDSLPQLEANITMQQIDLAQLTETFDFGSITGKLDGSIDNLRLSGWHPVSFDAIFATPQDDRSKRRISQQAVDNLTEVGGGPGGALSRGFLSFFKEFSYQKLGLSCKLRNNVCDMSGVLPTMEGYYIVKGGGFPPWIDVIGHTQKVDWADLLARLKAVSNSNGVVIE